eukprot:Nk52_evm1s587 gene=Nk52_evmTU1s587
MKTRLKNFIDSSIVQGEALSLPAHHGVFEMINIETQVRKMKQKFVRVAYGGRQQIWKMALKSWMQGIKRAKARIWNIDSMRDVCKNSDLPGCAIDALTSRTATPREPEDCQKEDILRTPIWQWVKRALIPRETDHAERKVLDKQVKGWHRKWEKIKCDRLEAWFNEDTNSFFSVEEMLNHFDREARADQLSAEEIAKTREVIKLLDTSLTACLRGKQRSPLLEGDWVRLQEEGPRNDYWYKVVKIRGDRVFAVNADVRDPQLKGA